MTYKKTYLGLMALSASLLALSGCSHPNAMPGGYTYHHDTYKSAAPPPSPRITTEQRKYMDAAQAEQFRDAVYELLERITGRAGMPPKPIYVMAPDPMTVFYANIDNDLREGMRHIGYAISDIPTGAYVFAYDARVLEKPRGYISGGEPNVELVLKIFDSVGPDARMLTEESGRYYIQGAEVLHIQPSQYTTLPTRTKIMSQEKDGFRAASVPAVRTAPARVSLPPQEPPATIPDDYSGPSQAVVIDSGGVSYE